MAAELLIQRGADVNFVGRGGNTPLMHAAEKGKSKWCSLSYYGSF